ncbi:MAG: ABC transporter ATP-binding protein [Lachnospiraceae bacterium]|nr:ABC transporter ATP-binding protein [Lachnospiraceae bacterium]
MKQLLRYLKGYGRESVIAPLFKMLEACFELVVPIVTARIIDIGIKNGNTPYIWRQCAILVAFGVIGLVCSLTAQFFAAKASMGFGTNLRKDLYRHINGLSYTELDKIGTPTLVTRITSDVNQVQTGVNLFLRLFLRSPFIVIGAVVMALSISFRMTLIFFAAVPLIALSIFVIVRLTIPIYKKVQNTLDKVVLLTRENYTGARVVRAFSRQEDEKKDFADTNARLMKTQLGAGWISALMNPMTYVLVNLAIITILLLGGREVMIGSLTQGEVIALVNYMNQILLALIALANLIITVTKAWASAIRVNEVFAEKTTMTEGTKEREEASNAHPSAVSFSHVTFFYEGAREPSLWDLSFTVQKGQTIGIIGGTGSGKSTLVNLIPRFYDAQEGQVSVNDMPVKAYTYEGLRSRIGIVPQKSVLFTGTIRDNMRWSDPTATDEQIWEALEIAQAKEFVEQKAGQLDEMSYTGGRNFSGGQRQRLCIARALVGKPDILILDDSASALDFATDAALRRALREKTRDMTTFLVSQRVATVRFADQILVLEDGRLTGMGSHEKLRKNCPVYREICQSQLSKEVEA